MRSFWHNRRLNLYELVSLLKERLAGEASLRDTLRVFCEHRNRTNTFRGPSADVVFFTLVELLGGNQKDIEAELARQNVPPSQEEPATPHRGIWALASWVIFQLNPTVSLEFGKGVIEGCLHHSTDMAFALIHSDAIASLAENHPPTSSASLIEICISDAEDSRAIYAMKAARWLPNWAEVRDCAFSAMMRGSVTKRVEAMWLINHRATVTEALSFAQERGIAIPKLMSKSTDVKLIAKLILNSQGEVGFHGVAYALRANEGIASRGQIKSISNHIRRLLEGR